MLQFEWEAAAGRPVQAVLGAGEQTLSDGSLALVAVAIILDDKAIVVRVHADTDEVIVTFEPFAANGDWRPVLRLQDMVSKALGWCWVGCNDRGYLDMFTLSLDGLDPTYSFLGEARRLRCLRTKAVTA